MKDFRKHQIFIEFYRAYTRYQKTSCNQPTKAESEYDAACQDIAERYDLTIRKLCFYRLLAQDIWNRVERM